MRKIIFGTLISFFLTILFTSSSFACSCVKPDTPLKELKKSNSVFVGKVTNVSESHDYIKNITLDVNKVFKGNLSKTIKIETADNSAACGFNFEKDKEYIVYTYKRDNGIEGASLCSRTNLLKNSLEDSKELEKSVIGIPSPASSYCLKNGGEIEIKKQSDGSEYANCKLSNGKVCEEWAYYRGECTNATNLSKTVLDTINKNMKKYKNKLSKYDKKNKKEMVSKTIIKIDELVKKMEKKLILSNKEKLIKEILSYLKLTMKELL